MKSTSSSGSQALGLSSARRLTCNRLNSFSTTYKPPASVHLLPFSSPSTQLHLLSFTSTFFLSFISSSSTLSVKHTLTLDLVSTITPLSQRSLSTHFHHASLHISLGCSDSHRLPHPLIPQLSPAEAQIFFISNHSTTWS